MRIDSPLILGDVEITGNITNSALKNAVDGYATTVSMDAYVSVNSVPYTGALGDVNLGVRNLTTTGIVNTGSIICSPLKTALDGYASSISSLNSAADGYLYTNPNATTLNALVTAAGANV